ncbi:hypothetical protein H1C71_030569, partial [Ictidomys tridecemlineatus]
APSMHTHAHAYSVNCPHQHTWPAAGTGDGGTGVRLAGRLERTGSKPGGCCLGPGLGNPRCLALSRSPSHTTFQASFPYVPPFPIPPLSQADYRLQLWSSQTVRILIEPTIMPILHFL